MLTPHQFHEVASGRRRGAGAALLRAALRAAETPYGAAVRLRNWRYDTGRAETHRVAAPVVSVGNLTVGGTGKTPLVEWLARWLRAREVRVALISRGYGAEEGARNDEALELEQKLPDTPHLQNADRVAAAATALEELESQFILLDDAFQHRRLHRDLDIVLIDALNPFGYDHLLPRGALREPLVSLRRADAVALSRADAVPAAEREAIRRRVHHVAPDAAWMELVHQPRRLLSSSGAETPVESLRGKPVAAFCGIGNPAGFRHTLGACGYQVSAWREFPDHHNYERSDIDDLTRWAADERGAEAVVCTHKDLVKIGVPRLGDKPLQALAIGAEFREGQASLEALLEPLVARALERG